MEKSVLILLLLYSIVNCTLAANGLAAFYPGNYCRRRPHPQCCPGRDDSCSMDISTTKCYCDEFCVRRPNKDCCPDYESFCDKRPTPITACNYKGHYFAPGQSIIFECHECKCTEIGVNTYEVFCTPIPGCNRPVPPTHLVDQINQGNFGWRATSYQFLHGSTLENIYRTRVGVCRPGSAAADIYYSRHYTNPSYLINLGTEFDARTQWPGLIQPISDQHDNPVSWAISTVDVIADRMSIRTKGRDTKNFSAQNLIGCVTQTPYCKATDKAWQYAFKYGITTEQCYPFVGQGSCDVSMGDELYTTRCTNDDSEGYLYRMPKQYKIPQNEDHIRYEIQMNGPVQAHLKVDEDFFYYQSGVYKHTPYSTPHTTTGNYLAVRIIGWGMEYSYSSNIKYWLCANSWGTQWGENGYFKILRGQNENEIESHVYSVWSVDQKSGLPSYEP